MKKEVVRNFAAGIYEDTLRGVLYAIAGTAFFLVGITLVLAFIAAVLWTVGAITVITANLIHGAGYSFGEEPFALGFLLWLPIALALGIVEAIIEMKHWICKRWILASGGVEVCSFWARGCEKGQEVWIDKDGNLWACEMKGYRKFKVYRVNKTRQTLIAKPIGDENENGKQ